MSELSTSEKHHISREKRIIDHLSSLGVNGDKEIKEYLSKHWRNQARLLRISRVGRHTFKKFLNKIKPEGYELWDL